MVHGYEISRYLAVSNDVCIGFDTKTSIAYSTYSVKYLLRADILEQIRYIIPNKIGKYLLVRRLQQSGKQRMT